MKIIHTADLHLGQIIYQNYDRRDEHAHFFAQLEKWCIEEEPDALLVCGDVFDVQQPSAAVKKSFNEFFVRLLKKCPRTRIVITAGNHDSASRLEADAAVWGLGNASVVGAPPPLSAESVPVPAAGGDWREKYIVRLESGYVVAFPHMPHGWRLPQAQSVLDKVAAENADGKPVVMTGHLAVAGADAAGHDFEIGNIKAVPASELGVGFDYLALGHIHRPQTLGAPPDGVPAARAVFPAPVIRYSGSCHRVSCDEEYPHSVSLVEIGARGGQVSVAPLVIDELRPFHVLPEDGGSFASADEAVAAAKRFAEEKEKKRGYFRLRMNYGADLPADFNQRLYDAIAPAGDEARYNPKILWTGVPADVGGNASAEPVFEIAELQQMTDPTEFVARTISQFPGLDLDEIRAAFDEVKAEAARLAEEKSAGTPRASSAREAADADE